MVVYILATGMITSIIALLAGITFYASPSTFVWLALCVLEAGLYANSLLAALNARVWITHRPSDSELAVSTGM
ncbi:hypothetical protein EDC04DRAFT_2657339 [Pisolithus marmoratus]|nr:hypothetical protein EDC04DRAFT_2657339 [Pisolithus marmoratus]